MVGRRDFCGNKHLEGSKTALESSEPLTSLWVGGLWQLEVSGHCLQVGAVLEQGISPFAGKGCESEHVVTWLGCLSLPVPPCPVQTERWEDLAGNAAGEVTRVLPHAPQEDAVKHHWASETATRAAAGLEKPVGFAQRWFSQFSSQAAEKSQHPSCSYNWALLPPCRWTGQRELPRCSHGLRGVEPARTGQARVWVC